MPASPHPIIEHLRRDTLNVDAEWSEDIAGGFRWWPNQQSQRIIGDAEMSTPDGDKLHRLVVETDIATLSVPVVAALDPLGALARLATLSGMVLGPDGTLRFPGCPCAGGGGSQHPRGIDRRCAVARGPPDRSP